MSAIPPSQSYQYDPNIPDPNITSTGAEVTPPKAFSQWQEDASTMLTYQINTMQTQLDQLSNVTVPSDTNSQTSLAQIKTDLGLLITNLKDANSKIDKLNLSNISPFLMGPAEDGSAGLFSYTNLIYTTAHTCRDLSILMPPSSDKTTVLNLGNILGGGTNQTAEPGIGGDLSNLCSNGLNPMTNS